MDYFAEGHSDASKLEGTTLILPAVSIGNVGQLAVDLLVEGLKPTRIGFLESQHVLPCVGNDPYGKTPSGILTTALEVYQEAEKRLTILQQRAPVMKGKLEGFAKDLGAWIAAAKFQEVIVLSGADAGKRKFSQMEGDQFRYVSSAALDLTGPQPDPRCGPLGWLPLEHLEDGVEDLEATLAQQLNIAEPESIGVNQTDESTVPRNGGPPGSFTGRSQMEDLSVSRNGRQTGDAGGGSRTGEPSVPRNGGQRGRIELEEEEGEMGNPGPLEGGWWGKEKETYVWNSAFWRLFRQLKPHEVPVLALLLFCNEGDNVPDGIAMANRVDTLLHLRGRAEAGPNQWSIPLSWAHLFGPPPDISMFG